jgi:hypothetical protein
MQESKAGTFDLFSTCGCVIYFIPLGLQCSVQITHLCCGKTFLASRSGKIKIQACQYCTCLESCTV